MGKQPKLNVQKYFKMMFWPYMYALLCTFNLDCLPAESGNVCCFWAYTCVQNLVECGVGLNDFCPKWAIIT